MRKGFYYALVCVLFLALVSCSHSKKQIKSEIEAMPSTPVNLCLDKNYEVIMVGSLVGNKSVKKVYDSRLH